MTFRCRTRLYTLALLTSLLSESRCLILYVLCREENDGWNAARRCNKSNLIHHGCPRADRKPCLESAISWSLQGRYWFIHSQDKAATFHPASLAAPSYYLISSWHQRSLTSALGRKRSLSVEFVWPASWQLFACHSVWLMLLFCPCCRRRAVWSPGNKVHARD